MSRYMCSCNLWALVGERYVQAKRIITADSGVEFLVMRAAQTINFLEDLARDSFELQEYLESLEEWAAHPENFPP